MALYVTYWISYSVRIIYQWVTLPIREGFSNIYLMGSILEINNVLWVYIYYLRRLAAQASA